MIHCPFEQKIHDYILRLLIFAISLFASIVNHLEASEVGMLIIIFWTPMYFMQI